MLRIAGLGPYEAILPTGPVEAGGLHDVPMFLHDPTRDAVHRDGIPANRAPDDNLERWRQPDGLHVLNRCRLRECLWDVSQPQLVVHCYRTKWQ